MAPHVLTAGESHSAAHASHWVQALLRTDENNGILLVQRLVLAAVFFPHGAQKLLGWFGGHGFRGTYGFFTQTLHLPGVLAVLVILAESIGSVLLALGLLSRVSAAGIASVMLGAIATTHYKVGFFMNWAGNQAGEGFEYHLLALGLALPLLWHGGGKAALDSWLAHRLASPSGHER